MKQLRSYFNVIKELTQCFRDNGYNYIACIKNGGYNGVNYICNIETIFNDVS